MASSNGIDACCSAAAKPASGERHGLALTSRIHGWPAASTRKSTRAQPRKPKQRPALPRPAGAAASKQRAVGRRRNRNGGACGDTRRNRPAIWPDGRRCAVCRAERRRSRSRPAEAPRARRARPARDRLNSRPSMNCSAKQGRPDCAARSASRSPQLRRHRRRAARRRRPCRASPAPRRP